MSSDVSTSDLIGANQTLDGLVWVLRQLRGNGINPSIEDFVKACLKDDTDPLVALARVSLLLSLAVQRLADQ